MTKKNTIIFFVVAAVLIPIVFFAFNPIRQLLIPQPTNEEFVQAITREFPAFLEDGKPVITINSISRYNYKWYIVTIKSINEVETFIPVRLLLIGTASDLSVVLGPDTHFTESQLAKHNLPNSVILELRKL